MKRFLSQLLTLAGLAAFSAATQAKLPEHSPVPGGVAVIAVGEGDKRPQVRYNERPVLVARSGEQWKAVVGVPLSAQAGEHTLNVNGSTLSFGIEDKAYEEQRITVSNRRHVNPDPVDMERITAERGRSRAALTAYTDSAPASLRMQLPVEGRRSSPFGLRRFFNDQPRNPHSGLDIAAPTGTPIKAPADGKVIETGDFFFNGNSVFLDHGHGLISMYFHLDRIDVEVGQRLAVGEQLGTVGATGRVTGPHLHWGIALNGHAVDPDLFIE